MATYPAAVQPLLQLFFEDGLAMGGIMATPMDNAHAPATSHQTTSQKSVESFPGLFGIQAMEINVGLD
jgi:hypothetical protein